MPYLVQIGFDYGTSFSKCVCRDLTTNRAWVYVPVGAKDGVFPFLIPGSIQVNDGRFIANTDSSVQYPTDGLFHLKLALERVARENWADPALDAFKKHGGTDDPVELRQFVVDANVFYLSRTLAGVRRGVKTHYADFGALPGDDLFVNMAIPVADASCPAVAELFGAVLRRAWVLSCSVGDIEAVAASEQRARLRCELAPVAASDFDPCFIYPEISANVQGFVRSRSARVGTYMFTDVGAGTVDQSTFVFLRHDDCDWLTYLHARVIPLGSSQIEHRVACMAGDTGPESLELWRIRKEKFESHDLLHTVCEEVQDEMGKATKGTVGCTWGKMYVARQLEQIRLLFGGGGFNDVVYQPGVEDHFGPPWLTRKITPETVGMPIPKDLDLEGGKAHWMERLYVAYGLAFFRSDLAGHTFPDQVKDVKAEERRITHDGIQGLPEKDLC